MDVRPFSALRPTEELAAAVAALPYDVVDVDEARADVERETHSFLAMDVPELHEDAAEEGEDVYDVVGRLFREAVADERYVRENAPAFYVYRLDDGTHSQTGLMGCCSVDDYLDGVIHIHETTRKVKEEGRVRHIRALDAHTGPVFLTYRDTNPAGLRLSMYLEAVTAAEPLFDFTDRWGVENTLWRVDDPELLTALEVACDSVDDAYIADGHHRAASAVRIATEERRRHPYFSGEEPWNWFLAVLVPARDLNLIAYNRVITPEEPVDVEAFLSGLAEAGFTVEALTEDAAPEPSATGEMTMFLDGRWHRVGRTDELNSHVAGLSAEDALDVAVLQSLILEPLLGIVDPREDERLDFVGGVRGTEELERRAGETGIAFALFPTSIDELMAVADAGSTMPPKSTWFEPKLRSGLVFHSLSLKTDE